MNIAVPPDGRFAALVLAAGDCLWISEENQAASGFGFGLRHIVQLRALS
jgi:hypothetical protein